VQDSFWREKKQPAQHPQLPQSQDRGAEEVARGGSEAGCGAEVNKCSVDDTTDGDDGGGAEVEGGGAGGELEMGIGSGLLVVTNSDDEVDRTGETVAISTTSDWPLKPAPHGKMTTNQQAQTTPITYLQTQWNTTNQNQNKHKEIQQSTTHAFGNPPTPPANKARP
jgi:hypothetical protein